MGEQNNDFARRKSNEPELRKKYQARLDDLEKYECNPWSNIDRFNLLLLAPECIVETKITKRKFDSITTSTSFHNEWPVEPTRGFQYIRYFEETGFPLHIANDALSGAVVRIANYSPFLAFSMFNKLGEHKDSNCELFYSQQKLSLLPAEKVNTLIDIYIKAVRYVFDNKLTDLSSEKDSFYSRLTKNLFESISRLTVKADSERLKKIFDLGIYTYNLNWAGRFFL